MPSKHFNNSLNAYSVPNTLLNSLTYITYHIIYFTDYKHYREKKLVVYYKITLQNASAIDCQKSNVWDSGLKECENKSLVRNINRVQVVPICKVEETKKKTG